MTALYQIDAADNVALTFNALEQGAEVSLAGETFHVSDAIPKGHKVALRDIEAGGVILKYGAPMGVATTDIRKGQWVHTHNVRTGLREHMEYVYSPDNSFPDTFTWDAEPPLRIYRRSTGKIGIRNELWVIPTVACVNATAQNIVAAFKAANTCEGVDGVYSFPHPYGCSQLGDDHERTRTILQNLALHPNAGGVLILGLGCENNQVDQLMESMPRDYDPERLLFMVAQTVPDEIEAGVDMLTRLYAKASQDKREPGEWKDMVIGLECGGSDAFSGITANPLIGRISDYVTQRGGTAVLTEVPEMFGAEQVVMNQCENREIFTHTVEMINAYKHYYSSHNQPIYENPSPGNHAGGITTLEEKSLGCIRKAGKSKIVDVVKVDGRVSKTGLNLLHSPGNDLVATTALGTAGSHLVLYSTGRGTPLGGFVPTIKISSNSNLAQLKPRWIDFDAGVLADSGVDHDQVLADLLRTMVNTINGAPSAAEKRNDRQLGIFKTGVTL